MLTFAYYLLKVIICSGILFGYYWFFLRNKNFHSYNRFYLLATILLSLAMPLLKVNIWQKESEPAPNVFKILQVVNSSDEYMDEVIVYSNRNHISKEQVIMILFIATCIVFLTLLLRGLYRVWLLLKTNPGKPIEKIYFIRTQAKGTPFSFFRFIFWNDAIDIDSRSGRQIFQHEVAHVQEKHSYDKLFINIVMIVFWCNPFYWLIRKELNMIHEFIADKKAIEDGNTADFAAMILHASYPQHDFQLTNNFFYSPIKRRLLMLTTQNKTKAGYISRLLVLPVAFFIFAAFTFKTKKFSEPVLTGEKQLLVVIDAGHGGNDLGAQGLNNFPEKEITLNIAKRIKELNHSANIKIVLTRETDIYYTPQQRTAFVKNAGADLLISIHTDGAPEVSKDMRSGMSVYISKSEYPNSESSKILASSVIASFKKNYLLEVNPAPQQREKGIWILQASNCPSVLIEAGCINNPKDFNYLKTDEAIENFAMNILDAIRNYASQNDQNKNAASTEPGKTAATDQAQNIPSTAENKDLDNHILADQVIIRQTGDALFSGHIKARFDDLSQKTLFILNGNEVGIATLREIDWNKVNSVRLLTPKTAMKTYHEKGKNGMMIINAGTESLFGDGKKLTVVDNTVYEGSAEEAIMLTLNNKNIESITLLDKPEAVKKYGTKAAHGAVEIITKPKEPENSGLTISLSGITGPSIAIDQLQNINELTTGNAGNSIKRASVYFSGKGFPDVVTANINGPSLQSLEKYFKQVQPGTILTFDNIIVQKNDGSEIELPGKAFSFYDPAKNDIIFTQVESQPQFPGGNDAWKEYLIKNVNAGLPVDEGWKPGTYKIVVQFIVDTEGNVSDIKTEDHPGSLTAQHCINLIKNGPRWIPATLNGKKVKAYRKQPITFVIAQ